MTEGLMVRGVDRRGLLRLLTLAGAGALAVACTQLPAPPGSSSVVSSTPSLVNIRSAYVQLNGSMAPAWVATDLNLYEKYGLKADMQFIPGGPTATAALVSGGLQLVQMSAAAVVSAGHGGADVVMVASYQTRPAAQLWADPSITSMQDLKGKAVAMTAIGGGPSVALQRVLERAGLTADDVTQIAGRTSEGQLGVYQAKQAQALMVIRPDNVAAQRAGAHLLVDVSKIDVPAIPVGVATTRSFIVTTRSTILAFLKAEIEAVHIFKTNRHQAEQSLAKYLNTQDQAIIDASYDAYADAFTEVASVSTDGMQVVLDESGDRTHVPADFVDPSFIQDLQVNGFFQTLS